MLVGLTPSQHLCLNTEDHNHHQRVFLTRWWALLSLNLEGRPPPPPTSQNDSLVGLTPSQHLCLNTEDHNHHQRVFLTHWWVYFSPCVSAPTYQPPPPSPTSLYDSLVAFLCHCSQLPAKTTKNESLLTRSSSLQPATSSHHHQRVVMTRWWLFFTVPPTYLQLQPPTSCYDSLVAFLHRSTRLPASTTNKSL